MEEAKERRHDSNHNNNIHLITSSFKANQIIDLIVSNQSAVIGVDIEAAIEMSRFGVICLIQIAYCNTVYIFDLVEMNHKEINLQKLFDQQNIIKVFHDCLEDLSLLSNLCHIKNPKGIFDTQIAHRMCYTSSDDFNSKNKNSSISLENLLQNYLGIEYELKGEMHELMAKNPYLWKARPIDKKLITYAGKDVLFLPQIYDIIKTNCMNKQINNITMTDIFRECDKYLNYVIINLKIKNFNRTNLQPKTVIQGLVKLDTDKKRYVLEVSQTSVIEKKEQIEKEKEIHDAAKDQDPKFPKLKVCVKTFIPRHLKKKNEKNYSNVIEEEKKSDISDNITSYMKDLNFNINTIIIQKTKDKSP